MSVTLTANSPASPSLKRNTHPVCLLPPLTQAVRVWLLTLPAALQQYADNLTGPGGLILHWDDKVGAGVRAN